MKQCAASGVAPRGRKVLIMARVAHHEAFGGMTRDEEIRSTSYQAYQILHWGFVAAPVIAGADKFVHLLTNWDGYLAPSLARLSPLSVHTTMLVVGVIEVIAGLIVAVKPRIGAYVVA